MPIQVHADYFAGKQAYDVDNFKTAFQEWEISAQEGDAKSQFSLGQLYEEGLGTIQNFVLAHVFYNLAASQGHKDAREARNAISGTMAKEQLAEAQQLAAQWQEISSEVGPPVASNIPEGLFRAADAGDIGGVKKSLDAGVDVNSQDSDGWTALMFASIGGHVEVAHHLLQAGADVNKQNNDGATPVKMARLTGQIDVVKALVKAGAPEGDIFQKVTVGDVAGVKAFLARGENVNFKDNDGWSLLMHASLQGHQDIATMLLEKGADVKAHSQDGTTSLMAATLRGDAELVRMLLAKGAKPSTKNKAGVSAMVIARKQEQSVIVQLLDEQSEASQKVTFSDIEQAVKNNNSTVVTRYLHQGGDPNASTGTGTPLLYVAIVNGFMESASLLIKAGADVNSMTMQADYPLHAAVRQGHAEVVHVLVQAGAEDNRVDKNKMTPLMLAVGAGDRNVVMVLLKNGVNANPPSNKKISPIHWAVRRYCQNHQQQDHDIILVLLKHGADPTNADRGYQSTVGEIKAKYSHETRCTKLLAMFKARGFTIN